MVGEQSLPRHRVQEQWRLVAICAAARIRQRRHPPGLHCIHASAHSADVRILSARHQRPDAVAGRGARARLQSVRVLDGILRGPANFGAEPGDRHCHIFRSFYGGSSASWIGDDGLGAAKAGKKTGTEGCLSCLSAPRLFTIAAPEPTDCVRQERSRPSHKVPQRRYTRLTYCTYRCPGFFMSNAALLAFSGVSNRCTWLVIRT